LEINSKANKSVFHCRKTFLFEERRLSSKTDGERCFSLKENVFLQIKTYFFEEKRFSLNKDIFLWRKNVFLQRKTFLGFLHVLECRG